MCAMVQGVESVNMLGYKKQIFRHHVGISVINKHVKISKLYPKMSDKIFKCGLCSLFSCQSQIHNANIKIVYFMCNYFEHFFDDFL